MVLSNSIARKVGVWPKQAAKLCSCGLFGEKEGRRIMVQGIPNPIALSLLGEHTAVQPWPA